MNYIARLQNDNAALTARIEAMEASIVAARVHLLSTKFQSEGDAWISTADADRLLVEVQTASAVEVAA